MLDFSSADIAGIKKPVWLFDFLQGDGLPFSSYSRVMFSSGFVLFSPFVTEIALQNTSTIGAKVGNITYAVDGNRRGGVATTASASFKLYNGGSEIEKMLEKNGWTLDGRDVEISLIDGSDPLTDGDQHVVFKGTVTEIEEDGDWLNYRLESMDTAYSTILPRRTYKPGDAAIWTGDEIKEALAGKRVPLVFGHCDMCMGYTLSDSHNAGGVDAGRLVQFSDAEPGSATEIYSIVKAMFGDQGLDEVTKGFADIDTASGRSPYTKIQNEGSIYFSQVNAEDLFLKMLIKCRSYALSQIGNTGVVDSRQAIDEDPDTYARVVPAVGNPPARFVQYKIPPIGLTGQISGSSNIGTYECYLVFKGYSQQGVSWFNTSDSNWRLWGASLDCTVVGAGANLFFYCPSYAFTASGAISNYDSEPNWMDYPLRYLNRAGSPTMSFYDTLAGLSSGWLLFGNSCDIGNTGGYQYLYQVALFVRFYVDFPKTGIYASVDGYEDLAGAPYTENDYYTVSNPGHLVQFLWGEFSDAGAANIDTAEGKALASILPSWKAARQIVTETSTIDIVSSLCENCLIWSWFDHEGKARIFPMQKVRHQGIPVSTGGSLQKEAVINGTLKRRKLSKLKDVVTDFTLRYHWNPVLDDFDRTLYCTRYGSSEGLGSTYQALCQDALDNHSAGRPNEKEYELGWIRDDFTALEIMKAIILRDSARRWEIEAECDLSELKWELGDAMVLAMGEWPELPNSLKAAEFRVTGKRIVPKSNRVILTSVEVK